ncbi:hypothetical protein WEN_02310 [Mycoplasma wenyonii str. Massachusetts]|uniref:Uncharacterized protein n=1 Tax=Mycoplasma wenyonii (strain Massachusetts) TaxID=1197325 RepID=I6YLU8_MYCWM|nr:hypothetical protein WEN_02310 [Mycoplasma wenyonii str. Massachusetts]
MVKLLLGAAVVVVPASATTMYVFRESIFNGLSGETEELAKRCFVIPTEQSDNQVQILACHSKAQESSSVSEYLLYNRKGNKEIEKIKEIKKEEDQLKISLEDSTDEEFNLKVSGDTWSRINTDLDLKVSCSLVADTADHGGTKWQCDGTVTSGTVSIPLSNFHN